MTAQELHTALATAFARLDGGQVIEAAAAFHKLAQLAPGAADVWSGLAALNWRAGDQTRALDFAARAASLAPRRCDLRIELALGLRRSGRLPEALEQWQAATQVDPASLTAWQGLAEAQCASGDLPAGLQSFQRTMSLGASDPGTLRAVGTLLQQLGDAAGAEAIWRSLSEQQPDRADAQLKYGEILFQLGRPAEALALYQKAIRRTPDSAALHLAAAQAHEDCGNRQEAIDEYRTALRLQPHWGLAIGALLSLLQAEAEPPLVEAAQAILAAPSPDSERAQVGYGLGKVLDRRGEFSGAFQAWAAANAARRRMIGPPDPQRLRRRIAGLTTAFPVPGWFAERRDWGLPDQRPVFVVGMPRSGTSLVEQILAAHSQVEGCGELPFIPELGEALAGEAPERLWVEAAAGFTADSVRKMAQDYLDRVAERIETAPALGSLRWIDKAPTNFFHLGLIAVMFPSARILYCQREPRDVCLSIFAENFGLTQTYATDLREIALYHRAQDHLMAHWQRVLPGRIHPVHYESLARDLGPGARALTAALGLEWQERCLDFAAQTRPVLTPSRWQVRQPVYQSSIDRWRNYQSWLGEMTEVLESPNPFADLQSPSLPSC